MGKENYHFYHDSIRQIIKEGGDTDTNACIAGGMIGATVGIKGGLPEYMVRKVSDCDSASISEYQKGKWRPSLLSTKKNMLKNIKTLIEQRPQGKIEIIC